MHMRKTWSLLACVAAVTGLMAGAGGASAASFGQQSVSVNGEVATPRTYSRADLGTLAQTSFSTKRGGTTYADSGVSLQTLVNASAPTLLPPALAKNAVLRVTITVKGRFGDSVTIALGEIDPGFGNHPAYLVLERNGSDLPLGPRLVIPSDRTDARTVFLVKTITVGVQDVVANPGTQLGDVTVTDGRRSNTLTAAQLARLPQETRTVSFGTGTGARTYTETGPRLVTVLLRAGFRITRGTWVASVAGFDGYVATATPGEDLFGGGPVLLSLRELEAGVPTSSVPRLAPTGDMVKGGRYNSGVTTLVVGEGS